MEYVDYGDEFQIEVECFKSDGTIRDESKLDELFERFSDAEDLVAHNGRSATN